MTTKQENELSRRVACFALSKAKGIRLATRIKNAAKIYRFVWKNKHRLVIPQI